jgi:hypothetical protein
MMFDVLSRFRSPISEQCADEQKRKRQEAKLSLEQELSHMISLYSHLYARNS